MPEFKNTASSSNNSSTNSQEEKKTALGDILLAKDLITAKQHEELNFEVLNTDKSPEEVLQEKGWVSEKDLAEARAEYLDVPFVSLAGESIPQDIISLIPEATVRNYKAIPFEISGGTLKVAMVDPLNLPAVELLEKATGMEVQPCLAEEGELTQALERFYGEEKVEAEISEAVEAAVPTTKIEEPTEELEGGDGYLREAPVSDIVEHLLGYAVKVGASDIHIEPGEEETRVRYRVDGVLGEKFPLPRSIHSSVVARIKILARLKLDERRRPQDGRFKLEIGDKRVDLRISIVPTIFGEKVVIRLLEEGGNVLDLPELGLSGVSLRRIRETLKIPEGIALVTGPTGSGKTFTLASMLTRVNKVGVNIITLEDPVEIQLPGVTQIQVNRDVDLTFASGLRSILRQDPDIIMVGEIRDEETAELAVHAALTGHQVFSTLHTNSAAGAPPRLMEMGAEPYLLVSTINVVIAQRLVRTVHEDCKKAVPVPEEVLEEMKQTLGDLFPDSPDTNENGDIIMYKGEGCEGCGGTGYKGRTGIFEVLTNSDKIAHLILEQRPAQELHELAVQEGMVTLTQDGYLKALQGLTTMEEVMRVTADI
ncbi:MAG: GspE/PulE family protein [Patescibacteria group bacterium]